MAGSLAERVNSPIYRMSAVPSCERDAMSSLRNTLRMWVSTVFSDTKSACAIARLVIPSSAIPATRRSAGVSASGPL